VSGAGRPLARVCAALPGLSAERRAAIAALPPTAAAHAGLVAELPALGAVEIAQPPRALELPDSVRVLAWNAERGRVFAAARSWLAAAAADVLLLSELDLGMARSGQLHVARELARHLGCGYAFAVEFLELGLGSAGERAGLAAGARNEVGYHGNAILSRAPLQRPALVRLDAGGEWFDGARGEARVGGRIAVLAQVELARAPVSFASVHLESHCDPGQRAAQLAALLAAVDAYAPGAPALVGGDLNSFSLALSELGDAERLAAALRDDPERWSAPERHEPLFAVAERAGFEWRTCNALGVPTHRHGAPGGSTRGRLKLDWFLCRGLEASSPRVLDAVDPGSGAALSDHEAIEVRVRAPRSGS
jgi:endonuclease/exonuclease/phosphatase family metal-dependent hydrolase